MNAHMGDNLARHALPESYAQYFMPEVSTQLVHRETILIFNADHTAF
jgi:hypothetical protein